MATATTKKKKKAAPVKKKAAPKKPVPVAKPIPKQNRPSPRSGHVLGPPPKPFSKDYQPATFEARSKGQKKRWALKALVEQSLGKNIGQGGVNYPQLAADFYGLPVEEVTIRMIMDFRQCEKAILQADTSAYIAVMDRSIGRPKTEIELIPDMTIKINGKKVGE